MNHFPEGTRLRLDIISQGAIKVNTHPNALPQVLLSAPPFLLLSFDLDSKYPGEALGGAIEGNAPRLYLYAGKRTLYLQDGQPRAEPTLIEFPDLIGYSVEFEKVGKYEVQVLLIQEGAEREARNRAFERINTPDE